MKSMCCKVTNTRFKSNHLLRNAVNMALRVNGGCVAVVSEAVVGHSLLMKSPWIEVMARLDQSLNTAFVAALESRFIFCEAFMVSVIFSTQVNASLFTSLHSINLSGYYLFMCVSSICSDMAGDDLHRDWIRKEGLVPSPWEMVSFSKRHSFEWFCSLLFIIFVVHYSFFGLLSQIFSEYLSKPCRIWSSRKGFLKTAWDSSGFKDDKSDLSTTGTQYFYGL